MGGRPSVSPFAHFWILNPKNIFPIPKIRKREKKKRFLYLNSALPPAKFRRRIHLGYFWNTDQISPSSWSDRPRALGSGTKAYSESTHDGSLSFAGPHVLPYPVGRQMAGDDSVPPPLHSRKGRTRSSLAISSFVYPQ